MFKVGDRVVVKGCCDNRQYTDEQGHHLMFTELMDEYIDKEFTIAYIIEYHDIYPVYELEDCFINRNGSRYDWKFVDDWLELPGIDINIEEDEFDAMLKE